MDRVPVETLLEVFAYATPSLFFRVPGHPRFDDVKALRRMASVCKQWRCLLRPLQESSIVVVGLWQAMKLQGDVARAKSISFKQVSSPLGQPSRELLKLMLMQAVKLQSLSMSSFLVEVDQVQPVSATLRSLRLHDLIVSTSLPLPSLPHLVQLSLVQVGYTNLAGLDTWVTPAFLPSLRILALQDGCARLLLRRAPIERFPLLRGFACDLTALPAACIHLPSFFPPQTLLDVDPSTLVSAAPITPSGDDDTSSSALSRPTSLVMSSSLEAVAPIATHIRLTSPSSICLLLLEHPAAGGHFFRALFRSKRTGNGRIEALYLEEVGRWQEDALEKDAGNLMREVAREMGVPVEVAKRGESADEFVLPRSFVEDAMRE
ncbi:hypothetical protein JCM6882_000572 [Rhodosporidiobolus microsporus]